MADQIKWKKEERRLALKGVCIPEILLHESDGSHSATWSILSLQKGGLGILSETERIYHAMAFSNVL